MNSDADQDSLTATLAAPQAFVFTNAGVLLWPELWFTWLEEHPEQADLLASVCRCTARLGAHTQWEEENLLHRLGCETTSKDEVKKFQPDQMELCGKYFQWVESLLLKSELDLPSDKRLAVAGAARFFAAAEKDLDLCQALMRTGAFSPLEYLRLGEIAQSWQCAIRGLPGSWGERARQTESMNPFIDDQTPHMSSKRLDMLNHPDAQTLFGPRIEKNVRKHLADCPVCQQAYERRSSKAARSSQRLIAVPA